MNKKNRFNRTETAIGLLVALCLLTCGSAAFAKPKFEITKAEWRKDRLELKVEGAGSEGETVNVFNAVTDALIGSASVNRDANWKLLVNSPASVPCRVRAESGGMAHEKAVKNAPDNCDETSGDILSENLVALHDSSSSQYNNHCVACHADILAGQSLDPSIPSAHVAMLPFAPGKDDEDKCIWCHRTVDLVQGTQPERELNGSLRKHVDAALCTLCHGPSGPAKQFYQVELSSLVTDGAALYGLICAGCHGDLANSEVRGESATEIMEEIADNEGGMGPLGVLTTEQIQAIAGALAP